MEHITEYQRWRKIKKKLRDNDIFKPLKYHKGDIVELKDKPESTWEEFLRKGVLYGNKLPKSIFFEPTNKIVKIYSQNDYKKGKEYIGDYNKDYLISFLDKYGDVIHNPGDFAWHSSVDENEILRKLTAEEIENLEMSKTMDKYNL
jgi:hypothetical protein